MRLPASLCGVSGDFFPTFLGQPPGTLLTALARSQLTQWDFIVCLPLCPTSRHLPQPVLRQLGVGLEGDQRLERR